MAADGIETISRPHKSRVGVSSLMINALIIACVSIVFCIQGFFTEIAPEIPEDRLTQIDRAVLRLMVADEVGGDDGLQKATDHLDSLINDVTANGGDQAELERFGFLSVVKKIRSALANSDRKSAVENLYAFQEKLTAAEAKDYREKIRMNPSNFNWFMVLGLLGLLFSLGLIWFAESVIRRKLAFESREKDERSNDLAIFKTQFDEERQRTVELQHRLIESGRTIRKLERNIGEYNDVISKLESSIKFLRSSMNEAEERRRILEAELDERARSQHEAVSRAASLEAVIDAAVRSEEALVRRFNESLTEKTSEIEALHVSKKVLQAQLDSVQEETNRTMERWNSDAREEAEALRNEIIQVRAKAESECAVADWSNTKLQKQIEEMTTEIQNLKETVATQSRTSRSEINKLRLDFDEEKSRSLQEMSDRYEAQIRLLQSELRDRISQSQIKMAL